VRNVQFKLVIKSRIFLSIFKIRQIREIYLTSREVIIWYHDVHCEDFETGPCRGCIGHLFETNTAKCVIIQ